MILATTGLLCGCGASEKTERTPDVEGDSTAEITSQEILSDAVGPDWSSPTYRKARTAFSESSAGLTAS